MTEYSEFLKSKFQTHIPSGFEINESDLNTNLFPFQKFIVKTALKKGKYATFCDTGLGKTLMSLEWANQVSKHTSKPVLILAPLAVLAQTIKEGVKFGIEVNKYGSGNIQINNYDQLDNIDCGLFSGIVLDESSILKSRMGATSKQVIDSFKNTPYKLACTATPSPNDHMELGNHAEFLNVMNYNEMLAMFFVHDGGETSKWRLRKHAENDFWAFVSTWAVSVDNPRTIGFEMKGYDLPGIEYIEHLISVENDSDELFTKTSVSAIEQKADLRKTIDIRVQKCKEIIAQNAPNEQWIIWGILNSETDQLGKHIENSVNVQGSDSPESKAANLIGFADNEFQNLITKREIASFGMNYQQCNNMIFCSYDFKFEQFYQAVRRCYRFGQKNKVNVHILIPQTQLNVLRTIREKEKKHKLMIKKMAESFLTNYKKEIEINTTMNEIVKEPNYTLIHGDCIEGIKTIESESIHFSIFSPPFSELYVYSDSIEDMGNSKNYDEFEKHFSYLVPELNRILIPGRNIAIHCMDLPIQKGKEGYIGLRDFSGMLIKMFNDNGFIYHSRVTLWKNPVTEMQRTKALGLLHKQVKKDSTMSRVGIPDYLLIFRKEGNNPIPVTNTELPVDLWQKYASPVWMDIDYGKTLNGRAGRSENDEKHICPLQLETIERAVHLWTNKGETVFTPFAGVGSELYQSMKMGRKAIGIELKESYFKIAVQNCNNAVLQDSQMLMF